MLSFQNADRKFYIESSLCRDADLKEWPIEYDSSSIIENMAEEKMLNICNAFAMEYTYHLTIPEEHKDSNSNYSELEYRYVCCTNQFDMVIYVMINLIIVINF